MELKTLDDISLDHQHIYLSPHFDDVVYSCGGTISTQTSKGEQVLVITVFAGTPPLHQSISSHALNLHRIMGFENQGLDKIIASRRQEDAKAVHFLQADYLWLDYIDAVYRGQPPYYWFKRMITWRVHFKDYWLGRQLSQDLIKVHQRLPHLTWYAPLGAGKHVDHQILTSAVKPLIERGANVKYYEDFPYVARMSKKSTLLNRLKDFKKPLQSIQVDISDTLLQRQQAAALYSSQLKLNFGTEARLYKSMEAYSKNLSSEEAHYFERFWFEEKQ